MTHKELREHGLSEYRIRQIREIQKELPEINELIYQTSSEELTAYDLGNFSDQDIIIRFQNQTEFDNINDFVKAQIANIRTEAQVAEETGRTLNYINSISEIKQALPNYDNDEIFKMSRKELIEALQVRYKELTGYWFQDGSDPAVIIMQINSL